MNDPVSFPCLLRVMGGWPIRITYAQMNGECSFDANGCELHFRGGDAESLTFSELHRIRVMDFDTRGAYIDLHPKSRGRHFRVWIRDDQRSKESKAFTQYMKLLGEHRGTPEEAAG